MATNGGFRSTKLKVELMSSCCSLPTCTECWDDAYMSTPGDRSTHENLDCRPTHPLTGKQNRFCCCYGVCLPTRIRSSSPQKSNTTKWCAVCERALPGADRLALAHI